MRARFERHSKGSEGLSGGAVDLGAETQHTLCWIAPGRIPRFYHCDCLWLSPDLQHHLLRGGIGTMSDWNESGQSDHVPVWADLVM